MKKTMLAALSLIIIITGISVLQSCSNNDDLNSIKTNSPFSKYDDLQPIAIVNNAIELEQVKTKVRNMIDSMASSKPTLLDSTKNKLQYRYRTKATQNNKIRFKVNNTERGPGEAGNTVDYGQYAINILMRWDQPMGSITTKSWLTGNELYFRYEEKDVNSTWSYGDNWCIPTSNIRGVVYFKFLFKGVLELWSENINFEVNGPVLERE